MKSIKCVHCGLVNWSTAEACKRCGVSLADEYGAEDNQWEGYQAQSFQGAPYPPYQTYGHYGGAPHRPKSTGLATASMIIGIVSLSTCGFGGIGAITGLILGIIARKRAKQNPAEYGGEGYALAGIITSAVSAFALVAYIGVVASIAIPNLLASRRAANEGSAISTLRTLNSAEATYQSTDGAGDFGMLPELIMKNLVDPKLGSGVKNGYRFQVRVTPRSRSTRASYQVVATPTEYGNTGTRSFYTDETGVIYAADKKGLEASASDQPLGESRYPSRTANPYE